MSGFDDHEREQIRERLVETGREHLLDYGPEKTTVADVTGPVGIAKSTFYRFFDSKAELYLEIFLRDRDRFLERLNDELDGVEDAETGVRRLFDVYLTWVEESPLLQALLEREDPQSVFRGIPEETIRRHEQEGLAEILPYLQAWQADGDLRDVDPEAVLGVMGAAALMVLHREEFESYDDEMYDAVRDLLVDAVARGLTE
jgi:AcrR family transcriptional regulator